MERRKGALTLAPSDARFVRLVFQRPGLVRGEVAELLGISPAGAAAAIRRLVGQGALHQHGQAASQGGRPASRLYVAPDLAVSFSHSLRSGALLSCMVNIAGEASHERVAIIAERADICVAMREAEGELISNLRGRQFAGVAISIPGLAHPDTRSHAKASWLFGNHVLDFTRERGAPQVLSLSNAEALLRTQGLVDGFPLADVALGIDLNDGATASVATAECPGIDLNLMALDPQPELFMPDRLRARILEVSRRPDSSLAQHLDGSTEFEALKSAEAAGDVAASGLVDHLSEQLANFVALLARLIRPAKLVLSAWLIDEGIARVEEVRRRVRRQCPPGIADRLAFRSSSVDSTHAIGAGLAAIDKWLEAMDSGRG